MFNMQTEWVWCMQDIATDIETYKRISNNETIEMKKTYNKYNCNPFKLLSIT